MANWRLKAIPVLVALGLIAACQMPPAPPLGAPSDATIASVQGPSGVANFVVQLTQDKAFHAVLGQRKVQAVDMARAVAIDVQVSGAGINGWLNVQTDRTFGSPDPNGDRLATFSGSVAAGQRRIFKVTVKDATGGGTVLETLWGVADIGVGTTTTVTVTRATTATAQVLRKLILGGDTAKALAIPVADVQAFVDKLLTMDNATNTPLANPIHYSLLNVDLAASAIAKGEGGQTYKVPSAMPAYLIPTPVKKGSARVKVLDVQGQPVTNSCVIYLSDYASKLVTTPINAVVDQTIPDVTPGNWTATVVDIVTGRSAQKAVSVSDGQTTTVSLSLPPAATEKVAGAYNLEAGTTSGFNEDGMHPSLTYLNTPSQMAIQGTKLYFVDSGNKRIRMLDLASNAPEVVTVAGNGQAFVSTAGEGANAKNVPIGIDMNCHIAFTATGSLIFSEQSANRVAKVDLATGLLTTFKSTSAIQLASSGSNYAPGPVAFDAATNKLYVGGSTGGTMFPRLVSVDMGTGAVTTVREFFAGGLLLSRTAAGNYLFYASGYNTYQVFRRNLDTNAVEIVVGKNQLYLGGDGVPAQDYYISGASLTLAYKSFSLDALGNLYFVGNGNIATGKIFRITNVLSGTEAANAWAINNLSLANATMSGVDGLVVDPTTGNLHFSGTWTIPNPNGGGTVNIHSLNMMRP